MPSQFYHQIVSFSFCKIIQAPWILFKKADLKMNMKIFKVKFPLRALKLPVFKLMFLDECLLFKANAIFPNTFVSDHKKLRREQKKNI